MKFYIVTLPLWGNFGGMLQAYTLLQTVKEIGVHAQVIQRSKENPLELKQNKFDTALTFIRRSLGKILLCLKPLPFEPISVAKVLTNLSCQFRRTFIPHLYIDENQSLPTSALYIVGSDQVWRKAYTGKNLGSFFLDTIPESLRAKSISYAASFGTDEWEGTPEETQRCGELLRQFKAVSVREFSGVRICKEVFGVDAVQMPDPTLLATLEDYVRVINSEKTRVPKAPYFASYVLDDSTEASLLLDEVEKSTGLYHQRLLPKSTARKRWDRFYCTVAQWLRYLRDCDAVVTDSFHGCVFSIIYNKPFVCLGNEGRGSARFDTLFQVFGLEDRLVASRDPEEVLRVLHLPIDWLRVNAIHEAERRRGLDFLRSNLYDGASPDEQG